MIAIIDYGLNNLLSVKRAFELYTKDIVITNDKSIIEKAHKIVLPGVGSFKNGMDSLNQLGLSDLICSEADKGKSILGICLGMQMLFGQSNEGGRNIGLGLIKGTVERIPPVDINNVLQDVPHVGWNKLMPFDGKGFKNTLFEGIPEDSEVYFVHSYEGKTADNADVLAYTLYGGRKICAAVSKNNVYGCQFHPEKSGKTGLQIIDKFINI